MRAALLLLCAVVAVVAQTPAGFQTCLTEDAFAYAAHIGASILEQQLNNIQIPDITKDASTPIGHVTFKLKNIVLGTLVIPDAILQLDKSTGITATVEDVTAAAHLDWSYEENSWPHVSDSGSADVAVSKTEVIVVLAVGMANQRPTVKTQSVKVSVGHLDITLHGGASWLYNLFIGLFQGDIQSAVESSLEQSLQQAIDQNAEQALATLPIIQDINDKINVDFGLVADPVFTNAYLVTQHHGAFNAVKHPFTFPGTPGAMPDKVNGMQVQMFMSEWSVNSLMDAFLEADMLHTVVTPDMVPASFPYPLNTNSSLWKYVCPTLPGLFPPNTPMQLLLEATSAPVVTILGNGAVVEAKGLVWVQVGPLQNGSIVDAFVLETDALASGDADVKRGNLTGSLTFINATVTPSNSTVGPVFGSMLNAIVGLMFKAIIPILNQQIAPGFPLPSIQGMSLVAPVVSWDTGYLAVTTNYTYTPPKNKLAHLIELQR